MFFFEKGLSSCEIVRIQKKYNIEFPVSLKAFLMEGVPISKGFYNWRDFSKANVELINKVIIEPEVEIMDKAREIYWCEEWGAEPNDMEIWEKIVIEKLRSAPKLVPIYAHRYLPEKISKDPPVISVHGVDVIYYGINLEEYLQIEFLGRKQNLTDFSQIDYIPFWSDIM